MGMKTGSWKVLLFVAACMLPVVASCKSNPLRVELSSGFTGQVTISCHATGSTLTSVAVNAQGSAEAATCPSNPVDIMVVRDGKRIAVDGAAIWETTGDGLPVGIKFTVR
jgi:hypothetical protein